MAEGTKKLKFCGDPVHLLDPGVRVFTIAIISKVLGLGRDLQSQSFISCYLLSLSLRSSLINNVTRVK